MTDAILFAKCMPILRYIFLCCQSYKEYAFNNRSIRYHSINLSISPCECKSPILKVIRVHIQIRNVVAISMYCVSSKQFFTFKLSIHLVRSLPLRLFPCSSRLKASIVVLSTFPPVWSSTSTVFSSLDLEYFLDLDSPL